MPDRITVNASSGEYPVVVGEGLDLGKLFLEVKEPCKAIVVSDDNVFPCYGNQVIESLEKNGYWADSFVVHNGEGSKTLQTVEALLDYLSKQNLTRSDLLVALGGGVVGDITGFAASIYLRGVSYVQMPTTILAAVDSSVGGKTGVNLGAGKNLAGAFHQPLGVFCDTKTFATLPKEVFDDGMAEVVKYGMIADRKLFESLHSLPVAEICLKCVGIKAEVVSKDEFDRGERMKLNFGHTIGHAVEKLSGYRIAHGHAVAIGMSVITTAGEKMGLTKQGCQIRLKEALAMFGLDTGCGFNSKELSEAVLFDKKRSGERITLVIPKEVGDVMLYELPATEVEGFISGGL